MESETKILIDLKNRVQGMIESLRSERRLQQSVLTKIEKVTEELESYLSIPNQ